MEHVNRNMDKLWHCEIRTVACDLWIIPMHGWLRLLFDPITHLVEENSRVGWANNIIHGYKTIAGIDRQFLRGLVSVPSRRNPRMGFWFHGRGANHEWGRN